MKIPQISFEDFALPLLGKRVLLQGVERDAQSPSVKNWLALHDFREPFLGVVQVNNLSYLFTQDKAFSYTNHDGSIGVRHEFGKIIVAPPLPSAFAPLMVACQPNHESWPAQTKRIKRPLVSFECVNTHQPLVTIGMGEEADLVRWFTNFDVHHEALDNSRRVLLVSELKKTTHNPNRPNASRKMI